MRQAILSLFVVGGIAGLVVVLSPKGSLPTPSPALKHAQRSSTSAKTKSHQPPASHQRAAEPVTHAPASPKPSVARTPVMDRSEPPRRPSGKQVTLTLSNGGAVSGELVSQTAQAVTLRWDWGDVSFKPTEIVRMAEGKAGTDEHDVALPWDQAHHKADWPHRHDIVAKLTTGSIVEADIAGVRPDALLVRHRMPNGGFAEQSIPRAQLEQLMFKPIRNAATEAKEAQLRETFPKMRWYQEGMFTIVTDSPSPTVKGYWRVIRELSTEFYLAYYPLLKDRPPTRQQYLVMFDDWTDYFDHALTDGIPGWAVVGYFLPSREVLYAYNMLGEQFSKLLYDAFLGRVRGTVDGAVDQYKQSVDERYHVFVDGLAVELKAKFERADGIIRAGFRNQTEQTLRHELTHALFHSWGLQTLVVSQLPVAELETAKKKREYLTSTEIQKKRQLLLELLNPKERRPVEVAASNSWLVEGSAGYMESLPLGQIHEERLAEYQEAAREKQVLPLEFLDTFRMGSFPGIAPKAQLYAYAQSWGLVHFLMHRYPEAFLAYIETARNMTQEGHELDWLLRATGEDLRSLDREFHDYMSQFPPQDPPWLVQYDALLEIFRSF